MRLEEPLTKKKVIPKYLRYLIELQKNICGLGMTNRKKKMGKLEYLWSITDEELLEFKLGETHSNVSRQEKK